MLSPSASAVQTCQTNRPYRDFGGLRQLHGQLHGMKWIGVTALQRDRFPALLYCVFDLGSLQKLSQERLTALVPKNGADGASK